jgi:nucleotide-binding universal stress UspA family protein
MSEQNPHPVVVAVGHDEMYAALEYAAGEVNRLGCGLHLVQFVQVVPDGPETVLVDVTDAQHVGRQRLHAAITRARYLIGDNTTLTSELVLGGVVPALVASARDARVVVLQCRKPSRMRRVVTRSVVSGVAAYAPVPLVAVPASWSVDRDTSSRPSVTVGVDVVERAYEILRAAVDAAQARHATLHVLHAWSFPGASEDIKVARLDGHRPPPATAEISTALDRLGDLVTGVPVRIDALHLNPVDALVRASRVSDLVVIGRHDPLAPLESHLGPVARAVLAEAACPVLLVDPRAQHRRNGQHRAAVHPAGRDAS